MLSECSDEKLIELYKSGNPQGMEVLYDRYVKKVYRLTLSRLNNQADAEDVTSQVFLKLCKSLKTFRGESKFSTWIYTITNNAIIDFTRKRKQVTSLDQDIDFNDGESVQRDIEDPSPGPEAQVLEKESVKLIVDAVSKLPESQRVVIELRYFLDSSYQEIADYLNIELGTVKSRISRAISYLRDNFSA